MNGILNTYNKDNHTLNIGDRYTHFANAKKNAAMLMFVVFRSG